jgi:chemotaxis-related protein WspB
MLFLLFQIGNDRYALEASHAVEVIPFLALKKIPHAPRGVAGIFNYRGEPVAALDLCELTLGRPARERLSTRIIVVECDESRVTGGQRATLTSPLIRHSPHVGLIAENATEMMHCEERDFMDSGVKVGDAPYLGPVIMDDKGVIQLLYASRLAELAKGVGERKFVEALEMSHEPD